MREATAIETAVHDQSPITAVTLVKLGASMRDKELVGINIPNSQ